MLPAIHIKKEEVGELFHRELGTRAGATDPTYLTEAARHKLREKFLAAQAGLTGVNFAVAETGGFVVCTNEGNADLGTSLFDQLVVCELMDDTAIADLLGLMEPVLIAFLGVTIGSIVISMYLPLFTLIGKLAGGAK